MKRLPRGLAEPQIPQGEAVRRLGEVLANVTVLTGLLVAFGWRRSAVQARELGIETSILGMTTVDFVLRSIGPVFLLLGVVVLTGLLFLVLDPVVRRRRRGPAWRRTTLLFTCSWLLLPLVVLLLGYIWPTLAFALFPLSLGGGVLLSLYALSLRNGQDRNWARLKLFGFAATVLSLFWAALNYAELEGISLADKFAADVRSSCAVVIYSHDRLFITAPGVDEETLTVEDVKFRFKYTGLRLVESSGGRLFLASNGWTKEEGVILAVRDDASVRFEFAR